MSDITAAPAQAPGDKMREHRRESSSPDVIPDNPGAGTQLASAGENGTVQTDAPSLLEPPPGRGTGDAQAGYVLQLQQIHGNRQVARMIAGRREPAESQPVLPPSLNQPTGPAGTPAQAGSVHAATLTGAQANPQDAVKNVDRGQLEEKKLELAPRLKSNENKLAQPQTQATTTAAKVASEIDKPASAAAPSQDKQKPQQGPAGGRAEAGVPRGQGEAGATETAAQAATLVDQSDGVSAVQAPPTPPTPVVFPEPALPTDAQGAPLPVDQAADAQVTNLAQRAQHLRAQGQRFRANAASARADAASIRGALGTARQTIGQAEAGVQTASGQLASRREIVGQAEQALGVSEQKTTMVAAQAPVHAAKAEEGSQQSGPMASEARQMASENSSHVPDDPEASGNAREQGQKLNQVGSDASNVDSAVTQTKARAESLGQDAARATQMNAQTRGKITTMQATLASTDNRITQMRGQNTQARAQVDALAEQPGQVLEKANTLDEEGQGLIQASQQIEAQLNQVQETYLAGMQTVPGVEPPRPSSAGPTVQRSSLLVQRSGYDDRASVNLGAHLPSWLTGQHGPSLQQRGEAQRRERERRRAQIAQINQMANGHFERLGPGDKALIALRLTGQNLFNSVSNINILEFGGHLLQGLVDPRMALSGVLGGLSMMLSGGANLLSAEQWSRDPLGNLLKSAADIATGLTIVLGSISGLAGVIILLMGALEILTLGVATPIAAPVIAFCTTVLGWTLPATIAVGKVALVLQALVLIKNLIDAATATTAENLQTSSDRITEDVSNAGNVLIQIGGAKLGQKMMQHGPTEVPEETLPPAPEAGPELGGESVEPTGGGAEPAEPSGTTPESAEPSNAGPESVEPAGTTPEAGGPEGVGTETAEPQGTAPESSESPAPSSETTEPASEGNQSTESQPGEGSQEGCFIAGTLVHTTSGPRPIEQVTIGERVLAFDPISGEHATQNVGQTFIRTVPVILDMQLSTTSITCSPEHPFWVIGAGWQKAAALKPGSLLLTHAGETARVESIKRREGSFTVYNLNVEGLNTYFVADVGILVHNKPMRARPDPPELAEARSGAEGRLNEMKARVRSALEELPEDSPNRGRLNEMLENLEDLHDQVADSSANVDSINNTMGEAARLEAEIPQAAGRNPTAASGGPGEGQAPTEGGTPKEGGSGSEPEGTPEGESPREGEPKTEEGEPTEGEPTTPASPVARMLRRIADLKRRAHDALRRVEELTPDSNPDKWGWRARASELRQTLRELDTVAERSTPEELGELVEPEVQTAEGQLSDLENELPRGPLENTEAAPPEPSQPSAPEPTIDQNVPVARQLEGQGQLRDLRSSPNIPEGVDLEGLLQRTPAELEQMVARGELDARVYRQIMKAFEGRDLAGRSGNR